MRSATELAAALRRGELGPVEAVDAHIEVAKPPPRPSANVATGGYPLINR